MMRNTIKLAAAFFATMTMMVSCAEENIVNSGEYKGSEVNFGASLSNNGTRTYYGEPTQNNYPVYWGDGSTHHPVDRISIYSPQCAAGRNFATYTVNVENEKQSVSTSITKVGQYGVQWGSASGPVNFYGVYPADAVVGTPNGSTMTLNIGYAQRVKAVMPSTEGNPGSGTYHATSVGIPDMNNAIMTAVTSVPEPTSNAIPLAFQPVATVLEIKINGYNGNLANISHTINQVLVRSDKQIIGEFIADFSTIENDKPTFSSVSQNVEDNKSLSITFGTPPTVEKGKSLDVKAFLVPTIEKEQTITIIIDTNRGRYQKSLKIDNIKAGQINRVNLPALTDKGTIVNNDEWMKYYDPATYLTELTIPGAIFAFSEKCQNRDTNKTPQQHLARLYNSGIRAFQFQTDRTQKLNLLHGNITMEQVLQELITLMKDHDQEVVYLQFSPGESSSGVTLAQYASYITALANKYKDNVVSGFDPAAINENTVLGDVGGKIILKINANNDPVNNVPTVDYGENSIPALVSLFEWVNPGPGLGSYAKFPVDQIMKWGTSSGLTYGNKANPDSGDPTGMHWCYVEANTTSQCTVNGVNLWGPAITSNLENAVTYYNQGLHNYWFYTHVGLDLDSEADSNYTITKSYVQRVADFMSDSLYEARPLGLIMMDFAYTQDANGDILSNTDPAVVTGSAALIPRLIANNSAFHLRVDENWVPKNGLQKSQNDSKLTFKGNLAGWDN